MAINRIDLKFSKLQENHKKAFIAYIMSGDPSIRITKKLIIELEKNGTDIIELGVPFSDPLADGPTIQKASIRGLKNKVTLPLVFNLVRDIREKTDIPIVLMLYYNLVFNYGINNFVKDAVVSGIDGAIIPDLPVEESKDIRDIAARYNFAIIHLLAPTSTPERIKKIVAASTGFLYYVSLTGTTGTREKLPEDLIKNLKRIKKMTYLPLCVGFGISKKSQVREIQKYADGVIVGSAIVKIIERNIDSKDIVKKVAAFVKRLV